MVTVRPIVHGLARVKARIEKRPAQGPHMRDAFRDVALLAQKYSSRNAPRDEGTLETAIITESTDSYAEVYVPQHSYAGSYAKKMHDDHYNPGKGTRQKGQHAGRLYIKRAIHDHRPAYKFLLQKGVDRSLRGL